MSKVVEEAKQKTDAEVVATLKELKSAELDIAAQSLVYFNEVFDRKLDLELGYSSIYDFAYGELGYSKDAAYARIRAAEALRLEPKMEDHLREGRISMTSLMQAQVAFRAENARRKKLDEPKLTRDERVAVLNEILESSARDAKKLLANRFPHLDKDNEQERIKHLSGNRVMLQIVMSQEEFEDLQRLRDLLAHTNYDGKYGPVIAKSNQLALEKLAPKAKPQPAKSEEPKEEQISFSFLPKEKPFAAKRKYTSVKTKRTLFTNACYQCQFVSADGRRCQNHYALEPDHIIPLALGGSNDISNMRILCDAHNRYLAWKAGLKRKREPTDECRH